MGFSLKHFLFGIFLGLWILIVFLRVEEYGHQNQVLSEKVTAATTTPTPIPTPTPTKTPEPTPTPIPTPTPVTYSTQEIDGFFNEYSSQYGVDIWYLRKIAVCESGYRATAKNLYYQGMYQFGEATWRSRRVAMGEDPNPTLRNDAREAIKTAAYLVSKGFAKSLWPNCTPE